MATAADRGTTPARYREPVLLSDRDIRAEVAHGRIRLEPWDPAMVQPSSVDVHLDRYFRLFDNHRYPYIDPAQEQPDSRVEVQTRRRLRPPEGS